jgi:hypothetical protein
MATLLAIFSGFLTVLSPILKALWPYILCILIGVYAAYRIHKWWTGSGTDTPSVIMEVVKTVETSNHYTIKAGLLDRRSRNIMLYGVQIADEPTALKTIGIEAGDTIKIEIIDGRKIGTGDISGIITNETGENVEIKLLSLGLAKNNDTSRKEWVKAETAAKKAGLGVWHNDPTPKPHPHWPFWKD